MKIFNIANMMDPLFDQSFADEGHASEELPDANLHEEQLLENQRNKDMSEGKGRATATSHVLKNILNAGIGTDVKKSFFTASGSVGWLEFDGVIYEIAVSPARYGHYYPLFKTETVTPLDD